ncbi:hypothetical protein D3C81_1876380 [compost metagenome]
MNIVLNVGSLRIVDDLHGRIVLDQGQIAVHIAVGLADRLADELTRSVMIFL